MAQNVMALPSIAPGADIDAYLNTISQFPILEPEHEKQLAEKFREDGDLNAARELVMCHLRFVVHLARSYKGYGLPQADLIQEGNVGLMKAVKRFDPDVGVRLISFAVHWIKAEMHEYILRNWRIVKVATTKAQRKLFFNLRSAKSSSSWLNQKETQAIAQDLGVSTDEVTRMEGRLSANDAAFDGYGTDEDTATAPVHFLASSMPDPADLVAEQDSAQDMSLRLTASLSQLDERSRDILQQRWLSDDKATLHELAAEYGVSAERIRQLEQNAIKKLKRLMST
ncbi:MAG TPA: RNA polymerase sigma factor RpoH [Gammaproteobacteria bacterium]|jgi:RNA polymerase sigma-32 factor|nr:MAG: RNA polymerase sigma factor RpoH [OM182 bacterium]HAL42690.1 RNA polymerase sigma factor RpoH [Gammaproteobacteria bacterium]HBK19478.1 RNA polymerase sigma factor RpoH [Gammaproteobacteria bacterium]|tara:strand:- start:2184 stop:3032 length:849 start_codon:yes stop_codon:yes gene_type:complete